MTFDVSVRTHVYWVECPKQTSTKIYPYTRGYVLCPSMDFCTSWQRLVHCRLIVWIILLLIIRLSNAYWVGDIMHISLAVTGGRNTRCEDLPLRVVSLLRQQRLLPGAAVPQVGRQPAQAASRTGQGREERESARKTARNRVEKA